MKKRVFTALTILGFFIGTAIFLLKDSDLMDGFSLNPSSISPKPQPTSAIVLRNNMRPFLGSIIKKSGSTIEVKNNDGSTIIVTFTKETQFSGGKESDLKVNKKISGSGKFDKRGIITAKSIQINPQSPLNTLNRK